MTAPETTNHTATHTLTVVGDAWQPIATAPQDGTSLLLFDGERVSYGGWISAADQGAEPGEEHLIAAGWWSVDLRDNKPTHWMPLPDPPARLRAS